jgi:hypothetical protein
VKRQNLDTEYIPLSLLKEAKEVLGEEFCRLTHRYQVGYVDIFWNNYGLNRSNRHSKELDSFKMSRKYVTRFFSDQKNFRAINNNGYYLGHKETKHGFSNKVSCSRGGKDGYTRHEPTNWVLLTCPAHGGKNVEGRHAGYQLAPKIVRMMETWFIRQLTDEDEEPQGMINMYGDKVEDVAKISGGGIFRDMSKVHRRVIVEVLVNINKAALRHHKEQLEIVRN